MRSVCISGFMGAGKSTVGPLVAARLGVPFVDTDAEIERRVGKSVPALWREEGEAAFRRREGALVAALLAESAPKVIALGGGTVTVEATRRLVIDRALLVTLTASPETVAARVGDASTRPNLMASGDPAARIHELIAQRAEAYAECHLALATDAIDPDGAADAVVALALRDPLVVPLGGRSYGIDVCTDEPTRLTDAVARLAPSSVVLVTDSNVQRARGAAIEASLHPLAARGTRVTLAPGEAHKTLASVSTIWDAALGAGIDREAVVIAAGGGVVGDLAGFAAASLLRGVRVVQVPTTLLAMVDSSVGGKTGFDHAAGKNLLGAFHQPSAVVADLGHLVTLPRRDLVAGMAEVVKVALATDAPLLEHIERSAAALAKGDLGELAPIVRASIDAKIRVVRDDEREAGRRALLNLGHTVGHAVEAHGGYTRWLHGEAVSLGTVAELRVTTALGWTPPGLVERAVALFEALGLPTRVDHAELVAAWPFVASDKKRDRDAVRLPVVTAPGQAHVERVGLRALRDAFLAHPGA